MTKGRLEAFSDAVLAIVITIMVLELKVPHEPTWSALCDLAPVFMSYLLSFVFLAIYWNNHHHLLHAAKKVNGPILWANIHLLFWLSLVPFVTGWMGENHFAMIPVMAYGIILIGAALAYNILVRILIRHHGKESLIAEAIGSDFKGNMSLILYAAAIPAAVLHPWISCGLYIAVALWWLVPDKRIENVIKD